eukprot:13952-Heterococcus_DN1.PRE.1
MDAYSAAAAAAASAITVVAPGARVRMADVIAHCCAHAEARCWLYYFADPSEPDSSTTDSTAPSVVDTTTTSTADTTASTAAAAHAELQWQQQLLGLDALPAQRSWRERMALEGESRFVAPVPPPTQEPAWVDTVRSLVPKDEARAGSKATSSSSSSGTVYAELQWVSGNNIYIYSMLIASAATL